MAVFRRIVRGKRLGTYSAKFVYHGQLYQHHGFPDKDTAQHWIDSTRISLRRGDVGYVKARTAAKVEPLIEEYADHLRTLKRSDKYAYNCEKRLGKIASEAPWINLADFTANSFEAWRAAKPKWRKRIIKARTLNQYLDHATEFGAWLVKPKQLLPSNPMASVSHQTAPTNDSYRRAATLEELTALLANSPPERAVVYRFLIYIPIRRRAIESIEWRDLVLDGERPTFTLRAELSKTRREAKMAIREDLAADLLKHRGDAGPDDRVFDRIPTMKELRADLLAAKVPFDDGKGGRRLDLHAFRKTVIRLLKKAGVSLDEAHVFLQHRDRRTTERHYDDDLVAPEITTAAEMMPAIDLGARLGKIFQTGKNAVGAQLGAQNTKRTEGRAE